jgi:aspartyl aminopeptidase
MKMAQASTEPLQHFVTRSDMGCGSTIGPITATRMGINTLDIGLPTYAMHSIRELAGTADAYSLYKILLN